MARPTFPVGVNVFIVRDGKLLLGKRTGTGFMDETWGVPGGHLEEREAMKECAMRELFEETGMSAKDFKFSCMTNDAHHNSTHYIQTGFIAVEPTGEPLVKEPERCREWKWFDLEDLPKDMFPPHVKLIELFALGKEQFLEN